MTAIEFVKDCGIDAGKRTLNNAIGFGCQEIELFNGKYIFRTDDLKQIVEAWELVDSYGGLNRSKLTVNYPAYLNNKESGTCYRLSKSINLVEQCNA